MQIRSFRGSGEPVWVNAHLLSARDCLGPDPRRALGPAATPAASTGRTRDRTRPMLQKCQKVLAMAPSTRSQGEVDGLASGNPRLTLLLKLPEGRMSRMTALVIAVLGSLYLPGQAVAP